MNRFQIILSIVCGVALIVAIMIFSGFIPTPTSSTTTVDTGIVTIWGTLPSNKFSYISNLLYQKDKTLNLNYIEIPEETFKDTLTEALADGTQPDLILFPNDLLVSLSPRIQPVPFVTFPEAIFRQTYIEASESLITQNGLLGIPVANDPLVLFYNRDVLSNAGIAEPIQYWDEAGRYIDAINIKSIGTKLTRSTFALGLFDNVANAKYIIATLFFQSGNQIVTRSVGANGSYLYQSNFASYANKDGVSTAETILSFYTRFSNPYDDFYSWNRSLVNSREAFLGGDLAYYFGFASELLNLRERNPNLNFAPTGVPQIRGTDKKTTISRLYSLSSLKNSLNPTGASNVLVMFADSELLKTFDVAYNLSPVHRTTISTNATSSNYGTIFDTQSLISKIWYDPSPVQSDAVFRDMISNIVTGRMKIGEALIKAESLLVSVR